jgi:hypothetical protein
MKKTQKEKKENPVYRFRENIKHRGGRPSLAKQKAEKTTFCSCLSGCKSVICEKLFCWYDSRNFQKRTP